MSSAPVDLATPAEFDVPRKRGTLHGYQWVIIALICSRLLICAVMLFSRMIFRPSGDWQAGGLLGCFLQWDASLWYLHIARGGYWFSLQSSSAMPFFPLYPILVKLASYVFHDFRIAGLVVSNLSLVAAGLLFNAVINLDYSDERINRNAAMFFMFNPYSFFFSSAYTESTFLLLALGSFLAARRNWWFLACVLGSLLSATRQVGVLIILPLFLEYVRQHWKPEESIWRLFHPRVLLLGLVPLGLGAYMVYSCLKFGDALAFAHAAAQGFHRYFSSPKVTLSSAYRYAPFFGWLFIGAIVVSLIIVVVGLRLRVRISYLAFASILTATYLCSSTLEALPRYLSVEFPLFIILGLLSTRFRWCYEPLLVASIGLLTLCTILSATGYWIT